MSRSYMNLNTPMSLRYGMDLHESSHHGYKSHKTYRRRYEQQCHYQMKTTMLGSPTVSWKNHLLLSERDNTTDITHYTQYQENAAEENKLKKPGQPSPGVIQILQENTRQLELAEECKKETKEKTPKKWRRLFSCFTGGPVVNDSTKKKDDQSVATHQT